MNNRLLLYAGLFLLYIALILNGHLTENQALIDSILPLFCLLVPAVMAGITYEATQKENKKGKTKIVRYAAITGFAMSLFLFSYFFDFLVVGTVITLGIGIASVIYIMSTHDEDN